MLPDQLQGSGGPLLARAVVHAGGASCAPAWQSGCLILVPGSGSDSAPAATAGAAPHPVVVAAFRRT